MSGKGRPFPNSLHAFDQLDDVPVGCLEEDVAYLAEALRLTLPCGARSFGAGRHFRPSCMVQTQPL